MRTAPELRKDEALRDRILAEQSRLIRRGLVDGRQNGHHFDPKIGPMPNMPRIVEETPVFRKVPLALYSSDGERVMIASFGTYTEPAGVLRIEHREQGTKYKLKAA